MLQMLSEQVHLTLTKLRYWLMYCVG